MGGWVFVVVVVLVIVVAVVASVMKERRRHRPHEASVPKPLLSRIPEMREPDSMVFCFASPTIQLPYRTSVATPWTTICSIPLDALVFPRRGRRVVAFILTVVWAPDHRMITRAEDFEPILKSTRALHDNE